MRKRIKLLAVGLLLILGIALSLTALTQKRSKEGKEERDTLNEFSCRQFIDMVYAKSDRADCILKKDERIYTDERITKQQACYILSSVIHEDSALSSRLVPVNIFEDNSEESDFFNEVLIARQYETSESYEARIYEVQKIQVCKITTVREVFEDTQRVIYASNYDKNSYIRSDFFSDNGDIVKEYRNAINELCHMGLIDIRIEESGVFFDPDTVISKEVAKLLIDTVYSTDKHSPAGSIAVRNSDDTYTDLVLCDSETLIALTRMSSYLCSIDEINTSFVAFDVNEILLCVWFVCEDNSLVCFPLDHAIGSVVSTDILLKNLYESQEDRIKRIENKLSICFSCFEEDTRLELTKQVTESVKNDKYAASFTYKDAKVNICAYDENILTVNVSKIVKEEHYD